MPVGGGPRGRRDGLTDPVPPKEEQGGKRVKAVSCHKSASANNLLRQYFYVLWMRVYGIVRNYSLLSTLPLDSTERPRTLGP